MSRLEQVRRLRHIAFPIALCVVVMTSLALFVMMGSLSTQLSSLESSDVVATTGRVAVAAVSPQLGRADLNGLLVDASGVQSFGGPQAATAGNMSSNLSAVDARHEEGARRFLNFVDKPEVIRLCPATMDTCSISASLLSHYPKSVEEYHHPIGTCKSSKRLPLEYSEEYFGDTDAASHNFSRFWPNIPDLRTGLPTEHERCHFVMARMLAIIATVLNKFGMRTWFLTHATLLGAVREGGFIPWDADVDIAMPRSHLTFLRKRWRREFPRDMFLQSEKTDTAFHMWNGKERAIRVKDRYSNFPGMKFSTQKGSKRYKQKKMHLGAHVDIIPLEKKTSKYKILHHYFDPDDIFPLTTVCFENMELPAPRNITKFLEIIYGSDFMRPPVNATFGGPTVLPCLATQRMRGNPWSLSWNIDQQQRPPKRWPRDDPDRGTFLSDFKTPHRLYYNSKW